MQLNRFKRTVLSLIIILSLTAALPFSAFAEEDGTFTITITSADAVEISTAEDLMQLVTDPAGSYILTKDIDMSGIDWNPVAFSGTLDGAGHTIYNLKVTKTGSAHADTIDGNAKIYDTVFAGFFSALTDARIENLNLRGVDIEIESSDHCFVGIMAGYMKNSLIANCSINDARGSLVSSIQPDQSNPRTSCNAGIGGIVGFASDGTIRNCSADTVLIFSDYCSRNLKVEEFMGGAFSCGNASILNCEIAIDGYDECRGYVHNGGLVGMFYQLDKEAEPDTIDGCTVSGMITFFEDNPDRRAYCEAFIGETMTWPVMGQNAQNFTRNETTDYYAQLSPESCENPQLTKTIQPGDCTNYGYTIHKCSLCGHSWKDTFTLPEHVPGQWVVASDPKNGTDGLRQLSCSKCGEILEEEVLKAVQSIALDSATLSMNYKDEAKISASTVPSDAADQQINWKSSDEKVATVDNNGNVHAVGRGTAEITASSADGFASSKCSVEVKYTVKQWIIKILLFGWIWY